MATNSTQLTSTAEGDHAWTKEAIFALVTMFIMVLLSGIGLACKNRMKTSDFWMRYRWGGITVDDEELAMIRVRSTTSGWVSIADVRRYQQDTYTSILRTRRGPRLLRPSSRTNNGRR